MSVLRKLGKAKPSNGESGGTFLVKAATDIGLHRFVPNMSNMFGANFPEHIGKVAQGTKIKKSRQVRPKAPHSKKPSVHANPKSGSKLAKAHVAKQQALPKPAKLPSRPNVAKPAKLPSLPKAPKAKSTYTPPKANDAVAMARKVQTSRRSTAKKPKPAKMGVTK